MYELDELSNALTSAHDKFELKCLSICYDSELEEEKLTEISKENTSVDKLCIKLQAKLKERVDQIKSGVKADLDEKEEEKVLFEVQKAKHEMENTWGMFNGKIGTFSKFYENFTSAMGKATDLSEGEKFTLLLEACQGETKNAVANSSYEQALSNLESIYGSSYRQMQYHTRKLMNIKPVSVASAGNLQLFYDEISECEEEIKKCIHESESDHMMTFVVIEKLDKETTRVWERYRLSLAESWANVEEASTIVREKKNYLPSFVTFKAFLKSEINMWLGEEGRLCVETSKCEMVDPFNKEKEKVPAFLQCKLCEYIHPIYKCLVFKAMDLGSKEKFVMQNNLCVKCLRSSHLGNCRDVSSNNACPKCSPFTYHNSVLCPKNMSNEIKQTPAKKSSEDGGDEWY